MSLIFFRTCGLKRSIIACSLKLVTQFTNYAFLLFIVTKHVDVPKEIIIHIANQI